MVVNEAPNQNIELKVDKKTFKEFVDKKVEDQGDNFINKLKESEKNKDKTTLEKYKETFSGIWKDTLKMVWENMRDNFHNIDSTNKKAPKLQTYIEAKNAFEEDMKTLGIVDVDMKKMILDIQEFIDLKQINTQTDRTKITSIPDRLKVTASDPKINIPDPLDPKKWMMDWVIAEIDKRIESVKKEKQDTQDKNLNIVLDSKPSLAIAQELFDKNQTARDALIAKNRNFEDKNKGKQQQNYEELLWFYWKAVWITSITWYECKKLANTGSDYIQIKGTWTNGKIIEQDIKLGTSTDVLHRARAESYKWEAKRSDTASIEENLNQLDGKWSYAQFENILKWQTEPTKFLSWLLGKDLLETINTNKPDSEAEAKGNRYYGVILDYIVSTKDEWLLTTYLNHVVVGNTIHTEYLWKDRNGQVANFNKIVGENKWAIVENSDNGKKLAQIKSQLTINTNPKTFQETLSKGFDALMDQFWPLLFNVLKLLGFGKWSLLKMFPGSKDKINEVFKKEYNLSEEAKNAIAEISTSETSYDKTDLENISTPPTSQQLQKSFAKTDSEIDTYIDKFTTNKNYYQYISISVFQQWLSTYGKQNKPNTNINDIVEITTDSEKKQTITKIKDSDKFKWIMQSILKSGSIWTRIATANEEIITPTKGKTKDRGDNEYFKNINDATISYSIKNKQDIVRYLTASLFSNKDLAYLMTENTLSNGMVYTKKPPEVTEEKLAFLGEGKFVKGNIVTEEGWKMKINEIIDTKSPTAPKKINITTAKGTTTEATLVTLKNNTKTYVATTNASKADLIINDRIQFGAWDKIEAVTEQVKTTPEMTALITKANTFKTEYAKIKTWTYNEFTLNTYEYKASANTNQTEYEKNILTPFKEFFEQFYTDTKKTDNKYMSDHVREEKFDITKLKTLDFKTVDLKKDYIMNIENMLIMMGGNDKTYQTTIVDKMKDLINDDNTYIQTFKDGKTEITIKDKAWTKTLWTLKFWYTENQDKTRTLTPEWIAWTTA